MKPRAILTTILVLILMLGGLYYLDYVINPLPRDRDLISNFGQDREALQNIKAYFDVSSERAFLYCPLGESDTQNVSEEGKACRSLRQLKAPYAGKRIVGDQIIFIPIGGRYLGLNEDYEGISADKGYAFSSSKPSPIVDSLDFWGNPDIEAFEPLGDNWYLYYQKSHSKPE